MSATRIGNENLYVEQEGRLVHLRLNGQGVSLDPDEAKQLGRVAAKMGDAAEEIESRENLAKQAAIEKRTEALKESAKKAKTEKKAKPK